MAFSTRSLALPVGAADHLDDDVDIRMVGERHRIVDPVDAGEIEAAILASGRAPRRR